MWKSVLRNFTKFTEKHLCQNLFFNKVTGLRPAILLKKRLWHRCFPMNFAKFLRTPFVTEHLWWLFWKFAIIHNWWRIFQLLTSYRTVSPIFISSWKVLHQNYIIRQRHCVKSVQIRSDFWSVFSRIRTEYGENTDHTLLRIWTLFSQCEYCIYQKGIICCSVSQ